MKLDRITEGELAIMQVIWSRGEPTTREITADLYAEVTDAKMASVQKLLERLEAKGYLSRDRNERAHRFRARLTHDEFTRDQMQALADRLCGGVLFDLATTLVRGRGISTKEREELRRLLDEPSERKRPPKKP